MPIDVFCPINVRTRHRCVFNPERIAAFSRGLVAEATYQIAHTHGIPAPPTVGELELGVAALEKFVKTFPKHELAPQAEFEIAQSYAQHGRFEQTVATLRTQIDAYRALSTSLAISMLR
jgi:hypothetical protein